MPASSGKDAIITSYNYLRCLTSMPWQIAAFVLMVTTGDWYVLGCYIILDHVGFEGCHNTCAQLNWSCRSTRQPLTVWGLRVGLSREVTEQLENLETPWCNVLHRWLEGSGVDRSILRHWLDNDCDCSLAAAGSNTRAPRLHMPQWFSKHRLMPSRH